MDKMTWRVKIMGINDIRFDEPITSERFISRNNAETALENIRRCFTGIRVALVGEVEEITRGTPAFESAINVDLLVLRGKSIL